MMEMSSRTGLNGSERIYSKLMVKLGNINIGVKSRGDQRKAGEDPRETHVTEAKR